MKIAFLLPVQNHVRFQKRISLLKELGVETDIFSFEREHYPGKTISYISIGKVKHGNYIKRIVPLIKALSKVRNSIRNSDVVYAFGLDTGFLGWFAKTLSRRNSKLVYEVGDIREIMVDEGKRGQTLRLMERLLVKRTNVIVVTSPAYVSEYFNKIQGITNSNFQVIENKMPYIPENAKYPLFSTNNKRPICIGYFGIIRCSRSLEILKQVAIQSKGRKKVIIHGIPRNIPRFEKNVAKTPNMEYGGPYRVPEDLAEMYCNIDLVWACYPYTGSKKGNWSWAMTNRFYEACAYRRPILAQRGTQDGKRATKLGIGLEIDLSDAKKSVEKILSVTPDSLVKWSKKIEKLPKEIFVYGDEHKKLLESLRA